MAECGSVTKAAQKLFMAQSTLSRHIASLERHLGVLLFDRRAHGVSLTRAGEAFIPEARVILSAVARGVDALHDLDSESG